MSWPICRARPSRQLRLFRLLQREGKIMLRQDRLRALIACVFVLVLSLSFPALAAKVGKEEQSETAAVRLLWAVGYVTEINYLVPRVTIPGKGTFANVRFEARPKQIKRLEEWKWAKNPFVGTRAFQGLKVMMALL